MVPRRICTAGLCFMFVAFPMLDAEGIRLAVKADNGGRVVTATLTSDTSTADCLSTLYAAESRDALKLAPSKRRRVGTGTGNGGPIVLAAAGIPQLARKAGGGTSTRVYFRARMACGDNISETGIASARFSTVPKRGVTFAAWTKALLRKLAVAQVKFDRVLSNLTFSLPLDLQNAGDGSNRIFVVEQGGRIYSIDLDEAAPEKRLFLDISDRTTGSGERGLLGLAFHPKFSTNGYFFVNYTETDSGASVIARFSRSAADASVADSGSEVRLLRVEQPFDNHNGGGLAFGSDGYLYIGLGDGGSGGDPGNRAQNGATLLGKMLRIDVDRSEGANAYAVPSDNPFVNSTSVLREIYATGFRNPYRFSIDRPTGRLWVGDVGQNAVEEIDIVEKGKNYGWNILEGNSCYPSGSVCDGSAFEVPVTEYSHSEGKSVTGGYVYRGSEVPTLIGKYIFGDFVSGRIWKLSQTGTLWAREELFDTAFNISSFGVDEAGELYVLSYGDGAVYRFLGK